METTAETLETQENDLLDAGSDGLGAGNGTEGPGSAANGEQTDPPEGGTEGTSGEGEGEEEFSLQFGDEVPPASESQGSEGENSTIRDMRKRIAELNRTVRQFEAKEQTQQPQQVQVPTLGAKPKLEDFDYDEGKFDEALGKWYETKRQVDAAQAEQQAAEGKRKQALEERQNSYRAGAARIKGFRELEDDVVDALDVTQQGVLLAGAEKPEYLVAALGKYPNKLKQLAQIKDPVRFAFAAGKLEGELKVSTSRTANNKAAPEGRVSSSAGAPAAGGGEKKLEQLRAEAEKTGDYSKVHAYKRQLKQAQARK
ncbi:MAG: hypothetical protein EPN70_03485 [Paraburkholderia sp.]|uniref:hypothetical protein n=1 Tax=Paraburkholderia sp. TaxID=1926495 RepID=UPI0011FA464C|nr:hypothetical protein [Paraburkholderia sp.]TAM07247.1 MAG: hypothetical protein EPN70_03485 [Paraburkholderia sp.]TAM32614.1 MAG: hypothetical protein EPN59_01575 [Paraburkholderia sp.]